MSSQNSKRELKPDQAIAAHTLDRHISVTAGPGSGKTTVLVERYLHILRENKNLNIDQIVAITFTNRAANEMRERLRSRLDHLLQTSSPRERPRWMRYKRTLDGAIITTIHGFCSRLLREFPVEAVIDPQFDLLDEHQAAILLEKAVEESLTEFINAGHPAVLRLTAGLGRARLADALAEIYRQVRGQGMSLAAIGEQASKSHSRWEEFCEGMSEVDVLMQQLASAGRLGLQADAKRMVAEREWPRLRELFLNDEFPLGDFCRELSEFRDAARPNATGAIGQTVKRLDELLWSDNRERPFGHVPRIRFDIEARTYAVESAKILMNVDRRLTEAKR
ncbi:MAG TPA: UvrD-helicase domain-containing protein, partial [Pyrinomonadaceae bacterium]|nr:UvrD-helicase domain-containing protein [Pyrinomonadaceae bacterium]